MPRACCHDAAYDGRADDTRLPRYPFTAMPLAYADTLTLIYYYALAMPPLLLDAALATPRFDAARCSRQISYVTIYAARYGASEGERVII